MSDPRTEKLADLLVNYSTGVKRGDKVAIQGNALAEPLFKEIYVKTLQAGGHPMSVPALPGLDELFFRHASDEQIQYVHGPARMVMETYDVIISLWGSDNTKALSNVPPTKLVLQQKAMGELF